MKSFVYQKLLLNVTVFSVFKGLITLGLDYSTQVTCTSPTVRVLYWYTA